MKKRLGLLLAAAAVLTISSAAFPSDLPRLDPEGACDRQSFNSPPRDRSTHRNVCIGIEQKAYERLKDIWPIATERQQQEAIATHGGPEPTYSDLLSYLTGILNRDENLRLIQEQKAPKRFHFD